MTANADAFLGVIAVGVAVMAITQIGLIVMLVRLARRMDALATQVEREIGPLAERLGAVADNLQRATALAGVQVERVDRLLAAVSRRTEETFGVVQHAIVGPVREVMGVVAAIRGVAGALRGLRRGDGPRPTFTELVAWAADRNAYASGSVGSRADDRPDRCPLCRFPGDDVVAPSADIAALVGAEYPAWRPADGLCGRCTDRYRFASRLGGTR